MALCAADPKIQVTWDPELAHGEDRGEYDALLRAAVVEAYAAVVKALPFGDGKTLALHVFTPATYESRFKGDLAQSGAHYRSGKINVNGGAQVNRPFKALLRHELVHAVLDSRGRGANVPTWLNEGIAEVFRFDYLGTDGFEPNQLEELLEAARTGRLTPLPARGTLSPFGYLQAYAAARYLYDAHGPVKLGVALSAMLLEEPPVPANKAFEKAYGLPPDGLERAFHAWLAQQRP